MVKAISSKNKKMIAKLEKSKGKLIKLTSIKGDVYGIYECCDRANKNIELGDGWYGLDDILDIEIVSLEHVANILNETSELAKKIITIISIDEE